MKADLACQWCLLDLQRLDMRLDQLAHKERTLSVIAELDQATARCTTLAEEVVLARTAVQDSERTVTKADADVQLVRDRAARDQQRLDTGAVSATDLQNLQHEFETLVRRQADLEDIELEMMERAETLRTELSVKEVAQVDAEDVVQQLSTRRDVADAAVAAERKQVTRDRANVADGIDVDLLAFYEKIREQQDGVGAAALTQKCCGGCGLELDRASLARIRTAAEDEVLRCEECRRILIRTAKSEL